MIDAKNRGDATINPSGTQQCVSTVKGQRGTKRYRAGRRIGELNDAALTLALVGRSEANVALEECVAGLSSGSARRIVTRITTTASKPLGLPAVSTMTDHVAGKKGTGGATDSQSRRQTCGR